MKLKLSTNKSDHKELLDQDFDLRVNLSLQVIKEAVTKFKHPWISISGGIHSCITAYLVNKVDKTVPAVFHNWGIMAKDYASNFCTEFCNKYRIPLVKIDSGYTTESFTEKYGYPIFKAIRSFIPKSEWPKYNITDACRKMKHICRKKFAAGYDCDCLFTGIMSDESSFRMMNYLKYGNFMPKSPDGVSVVKPIIHFRQAETMDLVHKFNIHISRVANVNFETGKFDEDVYVKCPTLFECTFCGHDFKKKGFGKLGLVFRHENKLFMEYWKKGLRASFMDMSSDYPDKIQLSNFIKYVDKSTQRTARQIR